MDQHNGAGPDVSQSPSEAPKRRRGAQPGNKNARKRKMSDYSGTPHIANLVEEALPKRRGRPPKVKIHPDTQIDAIADGIPPSTEAPKRKRGAPKGNTNAAGAKKLAAAMAETPIKFEEAPSKKKMGRPRTRPERDPGPLRIGRPPAIELTDQTLNQIRLLAKTRVTKAEAAAHFEVDYNTFDSFLRKHKKAQDVWTKGEAQFNIGLRSKQIELANSGNVPMLIWLGKQFLDQRDKHEHSGDSERPIATKGEMTFKVEFVKNAAYEHTITGAV